MCRVRANMNDARTLAAPILLAHQASIINAAPSITIVMAAIRHALKFAANGHDIARLFQLRYDNDTYVIIHKDA